MADVENHTLALLQKLNARFDGIEKRFDTFDRRLEAIDAKIVEGFEHLSDEIDAVKMSIAGETVLGRLAAAGMDKRFSDLERRIEALEQNRR